MTHQSQVKTEDLKELISLVREQSKEISESEGDTPSKWDREKYTDQLAARVESQMEDSQTT